MLTTNDSLEQLASVSRISGFARVAVWISQLSSFGMTVLRLGLVVVLVWIGGLKFAKYEADSIVPLVDNSPLLRFLYRYPPPQYRPYMNKEGELVPAHRAWQKANRTYVASRGLGVAIVLFGLLIASHRFYPQAAMIGSLLVVMMACTTLSFLITTRKPGCPLWEIRPMGFRSSPG